MVATIGNQQLNPTYDKRAGRFRDSSGKFISRAKILLLVDQEVARTENRMQGHARLLVARKIDLGQFQLRMAEDLKLSHLRMMALASGGRINASSTHYSAVGRELRRQYEYLVNFSYDLSEGKLTPSQAIKRASLYASSTRTAFHTSEKIARGREGFKLARRVLDANSQHCQSCLRHATGDRFVPIEQIVGIGSRCECQSRCRCFILWKKGS